MAFKSLDLAATLEYQERVKEAEEALRLAENTFGTDHPKYVEALDKLKAIHLDRVKSLDSDALYFLEQGNYEEAERNCKRSAL